MTLKYNQLADALAKLKFPEQGSDPTSYPNDGYLYSKDVAGKTELHYMDDSGAVTQVTSGGHLSLANSPAGGDLSGTFPSPTVAKVQGKAVSAAALQDGYVYVWNASAGMLSPQIQDGYRIQNRAVASTAPVDGYLYRWSASTSKWQPTTGAFVWSPLDTLTLLGLMPTTGLPDGSMAYVRNVDDTYILKRSASGYTVDGYDVVAAAGGGYWVSRMQGRWDDMQGDISQGTAGNALTYEAYRDTPFLMYFLRYDQNDTLSMRFQFSHKWRPGTGIRPHMHVVPMSNPVSTEEVYFDGYYAWDDGTNAIPAFSGWTRFTKFLPINPGDAFIEKYVDFGTITPPASAKESSILLIQIMRAGTTAADSYTTNKTPGTTQANLGLLSFDIHYRANKMGSLPERPT